MKDWTGTTVQQQALTVPCPDCHALVGELCVRDGDGKPLEHFPAHTRRVTNAGSHE